MNEKNYECIQSLLTYFMYYTVDGDDPIEDEEVIKLYVGEATEDLIETTIQEARVLLKEDPFPEHWIINTAMRGPFLSEEDIEKREKGLPYYSPTLHEWIEWMIVELEKGLGEKYGDK